MKYFIRNTVNISKTIVIVLKSLVRKISLHHLHHQDIRVNIKTLYTAVMIGVIVLVPSWQYFENANYHWTVYLLSFAASRFYLPIFLIYLFRENGLTWMQILVNHFGIILFALLCSLYFPSILADMQFIDRYDWFMVDAKIIVAIVCLAFIIPKLINKK